jgi:hypothetical protein
LTTVSATRPSDVGAWLRYGIIGGIVAGMVFAMFEMIMAALLDGAGAFFMPLRMIGGIALGPSAMDPATSLLVAGGAGLVVHMLLSMMYGIATVAILSLVPALSASRSMVLVVTSLAGLGLWIANFTSSRRSLAGPGSRTAPTRSSSSWPTCSSSALSSGWCSNERCSRTNGK